MAQMTIFGDSQPHPNEFHKAQKKTHKANPQAQSVAKRVAIHLIQRVEISPVEGVQSKPQSEALPSAVSDSAVAKWGRCRVCGMAIAIPGNDASLCSNPARTCGSSGWVTNLDWFTRSNQQGVSHE